MRWICNSLGALVLGMTLVCADAAAQFAPADSLSESDSTEVVSSSAADATAASSQSTADSVEASSLSTADAEVADSLNATIASEVGAPEAVTDGGASENRAFVRVVTNLPDAVLFADSIRIGIVTDELAAVPASTQRLRLASSDAESWSVPPMSHPFHAAPNDTVEVRLNFPYHYRIESIPFNAAVYLELDEEMRQLGSTPLLYTSDRPLETRLIVERPGYAMVRIEPGTQVWNRYVVRLSPSDDLDPTAAQVQWKPPKKHRTWIDYAAVGTALAAGIVAVHYKFRADDLYEEYEQSGDRSLRPRIHHLDVRSGIALGVMQAGIGLFAIRLALR